VLALGVFVALAQTPTEQQKGLPPELTLPDKPALEKQAETLQRILASAPQAKPGGGILTGLKGLFSPKPQKIVLPAKELWENAEPLRGSQIEVHGVLAASGNKLAFRTQRGEIPVDLGGGVKPEGFPGEDLDWMPAQAVGLVEMPFGKPVLRISSLKPSIPIASLRMARVLEEQGKYREALKAYDEATRVLQRAQLPWAAFASTQAGWIAYHRLRDAKAANRHLYMAWTTYALTDKHGNALFTTWVLSEDGKTWKEMPVADAVGPLLDSVGRDSFWYRLVDFFVTLGGGNAAIGVILLALVTRLGIHPLTLKQLASMEAMRKLQPQIKALQEEFKDDKQRFQQEMWKVWQENGVNPFGGCCWPMLIQMPILIFVYQGIRRYIVRFSESSFLWVHNLAMPDMALLIAYTLSMVFFQKMANRMQPMPADEKQRQQQQMMTWMMPLMFFFFFKTLPSAFILYWLASNLIYFGEQWWFRRQVEAREAAGEEATGAPGPRKGRSRFMEMMATAVERASGQEASTTADADPPKESGSSSDGDKPRSGSRKKKRKKR